MPAPTAQDSAVEPLWRAAVVFRILALLFAAGVVGANAADYRRQQAAWAVVSVMAAWTGYTSLRYWSPAGRRLRLVGADLLLTAALQYSSVYVLSETQLHSSFPTLTTVWTVGPVIAAGVLAGRPAGVVAGAVLTIVNVVTRGFIDADMGRDAVLLLGLGYLVGCAAAAERRSAALSRRALRAEAATAERERLARSIHDGVLQVLARARRLGVELGGPNAELGRLAEEQERALRALVVARPTADGIVDLNPLLQLLAAPAVQVSTPAGPVLLPVETAGELVAVVQEALTNAARHAGPAARVWVLVEESESEVTISVRDDGAGIPAGRLAEAESAGRMGVARSIRGRLADLGGTAELDSHPATGTEWEFRVPRPVVVAAPAGVVERVRAWVVRT